MSAEPVEDDPGWAAPTAGWDGSGPLVVDDAARMAAIDRFRLLQPPDRRDLRSVVELAAQVADVPTAVINLITPDEQVQVAAVGMDAGICAREDSMCAAILHEGVPVVVPDASKDARFADNPFVAGPIGDVRFYSAYPLITRDGVAIGTLCVFDTVPRELEEVRTQALEALAARIVDLLELALRSRELEETVARLTSAQAELQRSNAQLGRFASQVSHDLMNPLSAVSMALELVEDTPAGQDDDSAWALGKARSGVGRMQQMIQGLLAYARLGSNIERVPVDLAQATADVLDDLRAVVDDAVVEVEDLPTVVGDPVQLRALLQNLLANALKYTRPVRRPHVRVSARREATAWRVEVHDNGPGVPPHARDSAFELLVRHTEAAPGSGIGLATCRSVVESHGGQIAIDDSPMGGACVWFTVPAEPREEPGA